MIIGIILLAIAVVSFFIPIISEKKIGYHPDWLVFLILICTFAGTALLISGYQEKETTIDCFKGNYPYKQVIQYQYEGNELISQDTIYIKNEK